MHHCRRVYYHPFLPLELSTTETRTSEGSVVLSRDESTFELVIRLLDLERRGYTSVYRQPCVLSDNFCDIVIAVSFVTQFFF